MTRILRLVCWRLLAIISLVLGLIGILLPVVPTVPFMILSAWAGSKGWPALEAWLLSQPHLGPAILNWRLYGAVSRKAKYLATIMMLLSGVFIQFTPAPLWIKWLIPSIFLLVATWLWLRPEPKNPEPEKIAQENKND
ncbi:YbaN family protein [Rheinheimera salexigens]|uniref:YbaN family protein n=1 Tax=Rheinheimera salexigens TaxID=1628148 RepID=UPI0019147FD7|nr:YbaN family protein [Rheinheimera salexigens]